MKVSFATCITMLFSIGSATIISKRDENNYVNTIISEFDDELFANNYSAINDFPSVTAFTSIQYYNSSQISLPEEMDPINATSFQDNFWMIFDKKYLRHSYGWTITLVLAYTLILVVGVIGNVMVILVVIKRPQMRSVTNMFIMNLAVADLFVIVFCVPATLLSNILTPWILGSVMCKGVSYIQGVSVCASAYSLAAISVDRCKAIYQALEQPRGLSKRQALSTIFLIWAVALLLTIPWAVIFDVVYFKQDEMYVCVETWEKEIYGKIYYLVANLFCCYCIPLILISVSNIIIWCHVKKRKVPQDSASVASIKKMHRRTRHGVKKMLGIVTLAFLLSWLPLYVLVTRMKFADHISDEESNLFDILLPLAQLLGSLNSSINPILYAFLNSKFRKMFISLLPKWLPCCKGKRLKTLVRYSTGKATIKYRYRSTASMATYSQTGTVKNSTHSSKERHSNLTSNLKRKTFVINSVFDGSPEILVIVVDSPTASSTSARARCGKSYSFSSSGIPSVSDL